MRRLLAALVLLVSCVTPIHTRRPVYYEDRGKIELSNEHVFTCPLCGAEYSWRAEAERCIRICKRKK